MEDTTNRSAVMAAAPVPEDGALCVCDSECVARLVKHFYSIVSLANYKIQELPEEFACIRNARDMHNMLWSIREMAATLSKGELEFVSNERGFTIGSLKAFQSNLRHLTWQAQRIAAGEYQHRVNFLGEFSVAFNQMAEQLAGRIATLVSETEEYKDMSFRDGLTGIYNRKAFSQLAKKFLSHEANPTGSGVLVMCDIDHFKKFNDTYGHLCGDEVLRAFASRLTAALRPTDLCFRYGGEEFVLVMPNTLIKQGLSATERLRAAVAAMRVDFESHKLQITASFGLAEFKFCNADSELESCLTQCLQKADENLYRAKESGRNRVMADAE
ncbi:MAG: GGDEF domain-containing protein [Desulfovibrio sp.]|jgi:diguanylate cyclase (GGDEF)-like protein|nr:GGDEF domain-containing protein [Desulfovibrio sp.]